MSERHEADLPLRGMANFAHSDYSRFRFASATFARRHEFSATKLVSSCRGLLCLLFHCNHITELWKRKPLRPIASIFNLWSSN